MEEEKFQNVFKFSNFKIYPFFTGFLPLFKNYKSQKNFLQPPPRSVLFVLII